MNNCRDGYRLKFADTQRVRTVYSGGRIGRQVLEAKVFSAERRWNEPSPAGVRRTSDYLNAGQFAHGSYPPQG
jgi:hypothetical protein